MSFVHWLHHLFNPHCVECRLDAGCKMCDIMREQVASSRYREDQLLARILELTNPNKIEVETKPYEAPADIKPHIPWRQKKAELEAEDRLLAEQNREKQKRELEEARNKSESKEDKELEQEYTTKKLDDINELEEEVLRGVN